MALSGELTIYNAVKCKEKMLPHFEKCKSLVIDLSEVSEMDTSCFQILIQVKRELEKAGKQVALVNHSPAVIEILELYGMVDYFGDPLLLPAEAQPARSGKGVGR